MVGRSVSSLPSAPGAGPSQRGNVCGSATIASIGLPGTRILVCCANPAPMLPPHINTQNKRWIVCLLNASAMPERFFCNVICDQPQDVILDPVSYTHLRAHE